MRKGMAAIGVLLVFWGRGAFAAEGEQILAQVGEEVITVQEFLALASLIPALNSQGDVETGKRKLIEGLISQILFAKEAIELALDKDASVKTHQNAIEADEGEHPGPSISETADRRKNRHQRQGDPGIL